MAETPDHIRKEFDPKEQKRWWTNITRDITSTIVNGIAYKGGKQLEDNERKEIIKRMKQTTATNLVAKNTWEKSKENVMAVEATSNRHSECKTGT